MTSYIAARRGSGISHPRAASLCSNSRANPHGANQGGKLALHPIGMVRQPEVRCVRSACSISKSPAGEVTAYLAQPAYT